MLPGVLLHVVMAAGPVQAAGQLIPWARFRCPRLGFDPVPDPPLFIALGIGHLIRGASARQPAPVPRLTAPFRVKGGPGQPDPEAFPL